MIKYETPKGRILELPVLTYVKKPTRLAYYATLNQGIIEVYGDMDLGNYDWVHRLPNGEILKFTNYGYTCRDVAFRDAIQVVLGIH